MAGKLTSLLQWLNTVFARGATQVLVETDDDPTVTLPKPTPVIVVGTVNSGGTLTGNSATGTMPVTEASGSAISYNTGLIAYETQQPTFGAATIDTTNGLNRHKRIFSVDLTSDGAGAVAATTIVPALAGYTGHAQIIGIWASATDAASTWTFAVTGGTILGPSVHAIATTANAVTQFGAVQAGQTGCPIFIRGTLAADDNKPITISGAGYGNTNTATVFGFYWYET